jgi:hypothetical protein
MVGDYLKARASIRRGWCCCGTADEPAVPNDRPENRGRATVP